MKTGSKDPHPRYPKPLLVVALAVVLALTGGAIMAARPHSLNQAPTPQATTNLPSAQGNLASSGTGGHAPAWHGGAPEAASPGAAAQNNATALSGIKRKRFGGMGFNPLVFDDTPASCAYRLLITTYGAREGDPAGDNTAGMALLKQASALAESL